MSDLAFRKLIFGLVFSALPKLRRRPENGPSDTIVLYLKHSACPLSLKRLFGVIFQSGLVTFCTFCNVILDLNFQQQKMLLQKIFKQKAIVLA